MYIIPYPNEAMSEAQDALALDTVLAALAALDASREPPRAYLLEQIAAAVEHAECSDPENCVWSKPETQCVRCRIRELLAPQENV
jgi:hypothetical protein